MVGSEARCVYTRDPTKFLVLQTAPMVLKSGPTDPAPTLAWMQTNRPAEYAIYTRAREDATTKLAALLATITRNQQLADAFQDLQTAENTRDQTPQAYQSARNRYYTLLRGDTWEADERRRLLSAEVMPEITPYVQSLRTVSERQAQQATTQSAVDAVKSRLISLKDDFRITTSTLTKQVSELRNQIELQKRRAHETREETSQWGLNLILVLLSLIVIYVLIRRIMRKAPSSSSSSSSAQITVNRPATQGASTQTAGRR